MDGCPSELQLLAYLAEGESGDSVEEHLAGCARCRRVITQAARASSFAGDDAGGDALPDEAQTARVGRYLLGDVIGAGGMGIVHTAWDPRLGRAVAIKQLRPTGQAPERLLEEARAMACVTHPNVLPVYDAAVHGGRVYLVAELVTGSTLRAWLRAQPRSVASIVSIFAQVADGLAAAHDAGLVHRDVKPDNVLVDAGGRARVTDFGLSVSESRDVRGVAGTRGYVAPEVLAGGAATKESDQYAFFVALDEALRDSVVPRPLREALVRARAPEPRDRFASMHDVAALLRECAGAPPPRPRRRWAALAIAALGVAATGATLAARRPPGWAAPTDVRAHDKALGVARAELREPDEAPTREPEAAKAAPAPPGALVPATRPVAATSAPASAASSRPARAPATFADFPACAAYADAQCEGQPANLCAFARASLRREIDGEKPERRARFGALCSQRHAALTKTRDDNTRADAAIESELPACKEWIARSCAPEVRRREVTSSFCWDATITARHHALERRAQANATCQRALDSWDNRVDQAARDLARRQEDEESRRLLRRHGLRPF